MGKIAQFHVVLLDLCRPGQRAGGDGVSAGKRRVASGILHLAGGAHNAEHSSNTRAFQLICPAGSGTPTISNPGRYHRVHRHPATTTGHAPTMDTYANFSLLEQHEHDFSIELADRKVATTILAPHGGGIEPHTSEIARLIAGDEYNYFLFNGTKPSGNSTLHITSHRWDHPQAL
ncbi:MAG: poly-gamma-glutamate hydrolase family protein, partial [Desulfofustis sp.]|nr:poly-gamma-glutamate hydrolase family protein [Desulfofustis sp.]